MQNRLDTVFWAYFDEYLKKESSFSLRKTTIENKQKINEVYNVAYFAIFQYKLWNNETLSNIASEKYDDFAEYLVLNYQRFYEHLSNNTLKNSKFYLFNDEDVELIKEITTKLVLVHINKTSWIDQKEKYITNYYWSFSSLCSLALKYQYDFNFNNNDHKLYNSVAYPFLSTAVLIDIFDTKNMLKKVKQIFSKENLAYAFKNGRELSADEKKWILPQLTIVKREEDWNTFILNFSKENWEQFDINQRFKLIHDLSRLTTLFLKDNIKNIHFIADGDEVYEKLSNYLLLFLPLNKLEREKELAKENLKSVQALFASNYKDCNSKWTTSHIAKFKDYKKLDYIEDKLSEFLFRIRYVFDYIDFIKMNKVSNELISTEMINNKKAGLIETLDLFEFKTNKYFSKTKIIFLTSINLDLKYFEKMLQKTQRFEEIADSSTQMSIMLKALTLLITIDYKAPKAFNYSISELIKYYVLAFGPYKKNMTLFSVTDIDKIDAKLNRLLLQYEKLKDKNLVLDTIGILYKLQNFV